MRSFRTMACCGWISLFLIVPAATLAQEKKRAGKGIDPTTVAAYEKLGATYGGMEGSFHLIFREGQPAAETGLPAFLFRKDPKAKLPDVSVPFGLALGGSSTTDTRLTELTSLKNLTALDLTFASVTATG